MVTDKNASIGNDIGLLVITTLFSGVGAIAGMVVGARIYRRLF